MMALTLALALSTLAMPQSSNAGLRSLQGTAMIRERMALPNTAELLVTLNRTRAGKSAPLTKVILALDGKQSPFSFTVPYSTTSVGASDKLSLHAEVRVDGKTWFDSGADVVVSSKTSTIPSVLLKRVQVSSASIFDQPWELVSLSGQKISVSEGRLPSLIFGKDPATIRGYSGVNSFGADYEISGDLIQIDTGMMTKMASTPEKMELEGEFLRVLPTVNRWAIQNGELILSRGQKEFARFKRGKAQG
jgi:heat shock protein HslJ